MIREAEPNDAVALLRLIDQLGYTLDAEDLSGQLDRCTSVGGRVLVAEEEGRVCGFIAAATLPLFHLKESICRITALCVLEEYRGRGIGKQLLKAIEDHYRQQGEHYFELTSGRQRKQAHRFYENLGYLPYRGKRFTKRIDP